MAIARYEVHARYGTSETSVIGGGWRRNLNISESVPFGACCPDDRFRTKFGLY